MVNMYASFANVNNFSFIIQEKMKINVLILIMCCNYQNIRELKDEKK